MTTIRTTTVKTEHYNRKPALDAFTTETGIRTEVLFVDKGLEDRIAAEGENSPADVIVTVDVDAYRLL